MTSDPTNVTPCLMSYATIYNSVYHPLVHKSTEKSYRVSTINYVHLKYFMSFGEDFQHIID